MKLRARSGRWYCRFMANGKRHEITSGLAATERNRTRALEIASERRIEIIGGSPTPKRGLRFSDAAALFLDWADGEYSAHPSSARRIRTSFAAIGEFFGETLMTHVTLGQIENFKTWRRKFHQIREVTLRHDLHALSLFCQYAQRQGWMRENLVRRVKMPSDAEAIRMHIFSPEEERRYFAIAGSTFELKRNGKITKHGPFPALSDLCRLMLNQGCRPEELLSLRKSDVNLTARTFRIAGGKSKAAKRTLRMTDTSFAILERRVTQGSGPFIFRGRALGDPLTKLNNPHNAVREAAGIACVIYDWRHTFATRMAKAGMPLPTLAAILGHANLRSIMKYVHISEADMHAAMDQYANAIAVGQDRGKTTVLKRKVS